LDPKIAAIHKALRIRKIAVEELPDGIRIHLADPGYPQSIIDIYALRSNPDHVRAKIKQERGAEQVGENDLKKIRLKLQNELLGVANVGAFASLGRRGEAHYYYAHITISKKRTSDLMLVQRGAEEALEQLKAVDPGTFRKVLDDLGLPRSSLLRLALMRISRESFDIEEMLSVVNQESEVIAKSDDWKILKEIKDNNLSPFMNFIFELLWKAVAKERLRKTLEDIHN
jgi:hypothetical protein